MRNIFNIVVVDTEPFFSFWKYVGYNIELVWDKGRIGDPGNKVQAQLKSTNTFLQTWPWKHASRVQEWVWVRRGEDKNMPQEYRNEHELGGERNKRQLLVLNSLLLYYLHMSQFKPLSCKILYANAETHIRLWSMVRITQCTTGLVCYEHQQQHKENWREKLKEISEDVAAWDSEVQMINQMMQVWSLSTHTVLLPL